MTTLTEKRNLVQEFQIAFDLQGLDKFASNKHAFDLFALKGFPSSKSEEYKFTPITRALEKAFVANTGEAGKKVVPALLQLDGGALLRIHEHFTTLKQKEDAHGRQP